MIPLGVLASSYVAPAGATGPVQFLERVISGGATTSHTFTGVSAGAADANRVILLGVTTSVLSTDTTMAATINGSTATEDYEYGGALSNRHNIAFYHMAVPTGTTIDVGITLGASAYAVAYVFRAVGTVTPGTPTATYSSDGTPSRAVTIDSGGFALAVATHRGGTPTWAWTGATLGGSGDVSSAASATSSGTISVASGIVVSTALAVVPYALT